MQTSALQMENDMSDNNNPPTSYQEASNRGAYDANQGLAPAATNTWSHAAREAYDAQYAWQKQQNETK
jgi:hypothetical protein